ncbi:unnamed protein product, partial [Bubo scandiacus]
AAGKESSESQYRPENNKKKMSKRVGQERESEKGRTEEQDRKERYRKGVGRARNNSSMEKREVQERGRKGPGRTTRKQAKSFWGGLAEEARAAAERSEPEEVRVKPPPYAPHNGAEPERGRWGANAPGEQREEAPEPTSARKREGEENGEEEGGGADQEGEGSASEGRRAKQNAHRKKCPYRANTPPTRRRGEPRGRERPTRKGGGRGRSPTKT